MIADIHAAIFSDLATFGAANDVDVAFSNVDYSPGEKTYIEPFLLFAQTENIGMTAVNQPIVLQIDVNYRDGLGIIGASRIADSLISHYFKNRRIAAGSYCILFNGRGFIAPTLVSAGWLKMPVSFNLRILI